MQSLICRNSRSLAIVFVLLLHGSCHAHLGSKLALFAKTSKNHPAPSSWIVDLSILRGGFSEGDTPEHTDKDNDSPSQTHPYPLESNIQEQKQQQQLSPTHEVEPTSTKLTRQDLTTEVAPAFATRDSKNLFIGTAYFYPRQTASMSLWFFSFCTRSLSIPCS